MQSSALDPPVRLASSGSPRERFSGRTELRSPESDAPTLLVVVDTEEEFDWHGPFDRAFTTVESMRGVGAFQALCDERGVRPSYVITYPIATQPLGYGELRRFAEESRAQVGAHQHPWVCPPFEEPVDAFHSYPGNLAPALERAKLETLTEAIEASLGFRPTMYKAGRYGFGFATGELLEDLGYDVDLSPVGPMDHSDDGGPNDLDMPPTPFRFGRARDLYCFPATAGFVGRLPAALLPGAYNGSRHPALAWTRLPGILARTQLVERIQLSPEGYTLDEMKRLTRQLLSRGERVLTMTLHTPSLAPGHTPHVRTPEQLTAFLARIRDFFTYFFDDLGGRPGTPHEVAAELHTPPAPPRP